MKKSLRESIGKRTKKLGNRSQEKKRKSLTKNYQGSLQQSYYINRGKEDTKKKEKIERKLEVIEKFLRTRNLEGEAIL